MRKPLIGVTCSFRREGEHSVFYGVYAGYTRALDAAGALPVLLTPNLSEETLRALFERVDGVLLTGGGDVDPALYGAADDPGLRSLNPDRDRMEIALTRWAAEADKPTLGICRGIQVMNVALGGTLYRDIAAEFGQGIDHDLGGTKSRDHAGHTVALESGSRLAALIGDSAAAVNSMHHQAIRDLGKGLRPSATAPDGLVEGVEFQGARFIVGVQWHPEELFQYSVPMRRLFEGFVAQAAVE